MSSAGALHVGAPNREWTFLGVHVTELSSPSEHLVVARGTIPEGASPPLHVHADLDDSFYVLDGTMVVRCGDEVSIATAGTWVRFPAAIPHTFRVMQSPATVLMVHANDSFLNAVRTIGHPSVIAAPSTASGGPDIQELDRMLAEHDIMTVGTPMEADEAERWMARIGGGAA